MQSTKSIDDVLKTQVKLLDKGEKISTQFSIGNSDFKAVMEANGLIVDKSLFIKEIIDDKAQVKLIIRPRRFGKTFNMSMLKYFFDQREKEQGHLFHRLKIWQIEEDYRNQQGQYPVIFLTFKDIKADSFQEAYEEFQELLSELYKQYKSVLFEGLLKNNEDEKKTYQDIIDCKSSKAATKKALKKLTEYLYKAFRKRVILLIDEYDTPINYSYFHKFYDEMIFLIRDVLSPALKDNPALHQAILTGILRVSNESIFSGLNNIVVYSILRKAYSTHFGFLLEEIQDLLGDRLNKELMEQIEDWYGGYQIGENRLFNPWSIINFISSNNIWQGHLYGWQFHINSAFKEYWINTSDNEIIKKLLEKLGNLIKVKFKELIENKPVTEIISEHTIFANIDADQDTNLQAFWSFLLLQGYLTFIPNLHQIEKDNNKYELIIPNRELYGYYEKFIRQWFKDEDVNFRFRGIKENFIGWNLPRQDNIFYGRKKYLEEIYNLLHPQTISNPILPNERKLLNIISIAGLGGVGKTQLALQYVRHGTYPYTLKAWFSARDEVSLTHQYCEFAKAIGYIEIENESSIESVVQYVKNWLIKRSDWLMVFDDVYDYEQISRFLPEGEGHVIITSRQRNWPNKFNALYVDVMTELESVTFIEYIIGSSINNNEKKEIKELVEILGYLPLALAQAGAYIRQRGITISKYLELYKTEDNTLLGVTDNYSVKATLELSLKGIFNDDTKSKLTIELLKVCAHLSSEEIPRSILAEWLRTTYPTLFSDSLLNEILNKLWQYSLINFDTETGSNFVKVHRLLQAVMRHKYSDLKFEWYVPLLKAMYSLQRQGVDVEHDYYDKRFLIPHLKEVLAYTKSFESTKEIIEGYVNLALLYKATGETKFAIQYYKKALSLLSNRECTPLAMRLHKGLGRAYQSLGQFENAKKCYETAHLFLTQQPASLTEEAEILNDLGMIWRDLGEESQRKMEDEVQANQYFEKAFNYLNQSVEITKSLPNQIINIVRYMTNFGEVYRKLKNLDEATKIIQEAIAIGKKEFINEKHRLMASAYFNLGNVLMDKGCFKEAESCFKKAVEIDEIVVGKKHPLVARHLDALGMAWKYLGDMAKANGYFEQASNILESTGLGGEQLREQIKQHITESNNYYIQMKFPGSSQSQNIPPLLLSKLAQEINHIQQRPLPIVKKIVDNIKSKHKRSTSY